MAKAYIALGSNVGDRLGQLHQAMVALASLRQTRLTCFSRVYETAPVGPVSQGMFLNAVAGVETALLPAALLAELQGIETASGRASQVDRIHWGPRELDLDLLAYDQQVIAEAGLVVPHPELHKRWFVLKPLADVASDWVHPQQSRSVAQLLYDLEYRCDLRS